VKVDGPGGKVYDAARPGGAVSMPDEHAKLMQGSRNGRLGILTVNGTSIGTKAGRRCGGCGFLAQAWSVLCPRCGGDTAPE
jgi:hypothetical protein